MTRRYIPFFARRIFFALFFGLIFIGFAGCSSEKDEPGPIPGTNFRRTVLLYMAADNNLGSNNYDSSDLTELRNAVQAGALGSDAAVVVYHSRYGMAPVLTRITSAGSDTLMRFDRGTTAVSASRMEDVIALTRRHAPADKYGLVVWGHATGWLQDGIADDRTNYSFGPDGGSKMNISTLASVLEDAACFDYVYFDCCYMASVETVYELRRTCDYIVGSATELPAGGMNYSANLALLADGSRDALIESARNTFEMYNAKTGSSRTCTMAVVDTDALDALAEATRAVYEHVESSMPKGYTPQRFTGYGTECRYFDFYDYIENLGAPAAKLEAWKDAFGRAVLYSANTPFLWASVDLGRHHGLSTYIIREEANLGDRNYRSLQWYSDVASALPATALLPTF